MFFSKKFKSFMCKHNLLHENEIGFVFQCKNCNKLQIHFGYTALSFNWEEFIAFSQNLSHLISDDLTNQIVYMNTNSKNIIFCFRPDQLQKFNDLIQQSAILYQTNLLLKTDQTSE